MKEVPILFQREMIQAYRKGSKRMTRRTRGLDEINSSPNGWIYKGENEHGEWLFEHSEDVMTRWIKPQYGSPGETTLWFRETWGTNSRWDDVRPSKLPVPPEIPPSIFYAADYDENEHPDRLDKWRPSIFLPRAFARHTSTLLRARVERLQDITEADILAEGVTVDAVAKWCNHPWSSMPTLHHAWKVLWESINGFGSYDFNPWVGVYEFEPYKS